MERLLRGFAKNYKLYVKLLAAFVLFSCAVGLYLHKSAGGAGADEIIISDIGDTGDAAETEAAGGGASGDAATAPAGDGAAASEGAAPAPPETIVVDVGGAVQNPTVLVLPAGSRVYEALESAGGLLPQADMREINRATVLRDGDRIYVPSREEVAARTPVPGSAGGGAGAGLTNAATSQSGATGGTAAPININTADSTELQKLSGVGPSTAQKILDYREAHGLFARTEDLKNVSGIGDKTFEKLKDKIS
ncbi:MAG: helix-hairpin-helix domain-containing protein, partial [Clostridiales Family XIII bacterium]|nr:helix-hairpin-helix domain-containing protein [Clostridiales Family XIII bacterium]